MKRAKKIPRILFAAPGSGNGKTVVTCGVLELLRQRGISCRSFKCGPDYIDPMFHRYVLGIPGCNLDSFFLNPEQVRELFWEKAGNGNLAVIEGAMGYYDGIAGISSQASAYEIAKITDTPVILVVDGRKSSLSLAALVKGFLEYEKDSRICGVILNRVSSAAACRLRPSLEKLGVSLYGSVPQCPEAEFESRHLGLTLPGEQERLRERIEALAGRMSSCVDIDGLLELADGTSLMERDRGKKPSETLVKPAGTAKRVRRIAIARDEAFCFYYEENLELLKKEGWELIPFSPLHDEGLPCGISAILLGGGYPEKYARELSENCGMMEQIRRASVQGIKILAECGGFLYLHRSLEGMDGKNYPMAGLIQADGYRTESLSRFGYVVLYDQEGRMVARGHEFHYWDSTMPGDSLKAVKPLSLRKWDCMYVTDKMIAGFPHLYYGGNPEWVLEFLESGR